MYAVIATGGKQEKVAEGDRVNVELLGAEDGATVTFTPVMLVDGDDIRATPAQLGKASVSARVVGTVSGPKVTGFRYKNKTNQRKRWGHRQHYSQIEITSITKG